MVVETPDLVALASERNVVRPNLAIDPPFKRQRLGAGEKSPDPKCDSPRVQAHKKGWDATNWDLDVQQPHGGQEWSQITNFVEDFSVTTNYFGPPTKALAACGLALSDVEHYPPANFEPHLSELAAFLQPGEPEELVPRLMLGNGASEIIDLVTRVGSHEGSFATRSSVQYKEYERAASAAGRQMAAPLGGDDACGETASPGMLAVVNPCNPTGDYLGVQAMKQYIEKSCREGMTVLVDESMQPWHGPHWRDDSLVSQREWISSMYRTRDIRVYVIHSWTKIWSCPGIRLGSIICPSREMASAMKKHQVPWSLNVFALRFLSAAIKDREYMQRTWMTVPILRQRTIDELGKMFPSWAFHGERWLSWLWIDTKSADVAERAVKLAKSAGVPIRNGAMGYGLPTYIRIKVADAEKQDVLFQALKPLAQ